MENLALKLLSFQKEVGAIKKDSVNPFFKSKYADINTYIEVVKPLLSKHGLVLLQPLTSINNKPALLTMIIDSESSERIELTIPLPDSANVVEEEVIKDKKKVTTYSDPQKMGAIITYFRRFAIQSMLCLEAEDDDGEKAVSHIPTNHMTTVDTAAVERNSAHELAKNFGGVVVEDYGNCNKCGAANKWSQKASKPYCGAMCWKAQ